MCLNMMKVFSTYILAIFVIYTEASFTIIVPAAGNCGDDTVLVCQVTGNIGTTGWFGLGRSLLKNGVPARPEDNNKYTETRGTSSFTLTIHNTDLTDEGDYWCRNRIDKSKPKRLNIECKASPADMSVTNGKKFSITVDKLYPSQPAFSASFKKESTDVKVKGSTACSSSTQYKGYYKCIWSASSSLADGLYTYSMVVTTITQADPLTGSFNIASTTIIVPAAGNCGDDTVLTCKVPGNIGTTGWYGLGRLLLKNGVPARPEDNNKYTETRGTSSFTLTIHITDPTDEGEYWCRNGIDESQPKRLNIECKASAADLSVTNGKKVSITVDKLYPSQLAFSASFKKESTDVKVQGSTACSSSTQYKGYFKCIWSASSSLADGLYTYSIVVTAITQADPLTGSFNIVSPKSPVISHTTVLDDNKIILYCNKGQSVTIVCISTGGYPIQTVAWYKDSVSTSNQLASTSSGSLQNDGTYAVTLPHTFTPTVTDDKKTLICRSYYPHADSAYRGSETTAVMIYLRLKPSQPTVTQVSDVSSGGTVEVRCTTTGSRPAATITWFYQGSTFTGQDSSKTDTATETYTVVSIFRRRVTAADNGREVQCIVTHPELVSPPERTASVNLNVQSYVEEKSASAVAGAVGGTFAGLIIIALVIILVVMYRRKSCTKENLRDVVARKIMRKKTNADENTIEMSSQENPVGVYEQLQRSEERGTIYDSLEVTTDNKNVYENVKNEA